MVLQKALDNIEHVKAPIEHAGGVNWVPSLETTINPRA
jgi:hypothetical protein